MASAPATVGCVLALCVFSAPGVRAQGGPPFFTNDPGTPGNRQWEINVGYIPLLATDHSTTRTPDLDLNFGLGDRIQLTLEMAWLGDQIPPAATKYGLAQDALGVKWRFFGDDPGLAVSIFPQVLINNPSRSVARGIVPPGNSLTLPIEWSKQIGFIAVNGEAGYTVVQSAAGQWLAGVVAGHEKRIKHRTASVEFDGEFYLTGESANHVTQETLEGGCRIELHPPFVLLAMAGRSVRQTDGSFTAYLGVQLLLPRKPFESR